MKYTKSSAWSKAGDPADRRVLLSVALPPWPPRRGWSQGRTPMATTAVRCCCHDAREWLVSWIGTVLSDSAGGGDSATPGRRNAGRMWNVSEQGHCEGHCKTLSTPPPPCSSSRNSQPGLVLLMKNIVSEFILCLESDLGFVCLCVKWICRQQCPGLKKKGEEPKQQGHLLVNGVPLPRLLKLQLKLPIAKKSKNKSLIVREFFSPDTSPAKCCKQAPHFQVWLMSSRLCGNASSIDVSAVGEAC